MPRATPGGIVYHVLNRANAGLTIFRDAAEYAAFEQALAEAHARVPVRILAWCLLPDHWHLVVWPRREHDLSEFMRWLTVTHTRRWHAHRDVSGSGHLYQGRYRSFPVEPGESLLTVMRYVESNALRDKRVRRAEDWAWSSLAHRPGVAKAAKGKGKKRPAGADGDLALSAAELLDDGPTDLPRDWVARVNAPLTPEELKPLRNSAQRGAPFGSGKWTAKVVEKMGLQHTLRPRGRPRKVHLPGEDDPKARPKTPSARKSAGGAHPAHPPHRTRKAATAAPRKRRGQ